MKQFVFSAFADEAASGIEAQIAALERNEIGRIEIRNVGGTCIIDLEYDEIRRIGALLASHGIRVSAIASPIGKISVAEDFAVHKKRFVRAMEAAELLGTDRIRIFSFFIPQGMPPANYTDDVLKRLDDMAECAAKRRLFLCHENEKGIYGEQPEQVKTLLDALETEYFTTVFDPANYVQAGADPEAAYGMTKRRIRYFHVKDAQKGSGTVVPAGFGDGKIRSILRDAADQKFFPKPICLTVEPHLAAFEGYRNLGDDTPLGTDRFCFKDNNESFDAACGALKTLLHDMTLSY